MSSIDIEQVYHDYGKLLYSIAYNILKNKNDASDAMQQTFIKIIKYENKIITMDDNHLKSYIAIIAKHEAINIFNKNKKLVTNMEDKWLYNIEDEKENIDEILARAELKKEMHEFINMLDENEKNIIILKCIHEFSYNEISELMDLSNEAVRTRVSRAKRKLAHIIKSKSEIEK